MRTIDISQTAVAALRAYKTDIKTMADHFGISTKEMRDVLVGFGFAKPTKTTVDYIINPVFDFDVKRSSVENIVEAVDSFVDNTAPRELVYNAEAAAFETQG